MMKSIIAMLLAFLFVPKFSLSSCSQGEKGRDGAEKIHFDKPYLSQNQDTIVGNFSGHGLDALVREPVDSLSKGEDEDDPMAGHHFTWRIRSLNGTVKDVIVHNTIGIHFVKEGDLDSNGTDEFGFRAEWPTSEWASYRVYTYDKGEWKYLVSPISSWSDDYYDAFHDGKDVIKPAKRKGYVVIKTTEVNGNGDFIRKTAVKPARIQRIIEEQDLY